MNTNMKDLRFYATIPSETKKSKKFVNTLRKQLLIQEFGSAEETKPLKQYESQFIQIRIDTPVLRSQQYRKIVSMTSKIIPPCNKNFPGTTSTSNKKSPPRTDASLFIDQNLNVRLRRLSIAQRKLERNSVLSQISTLPPIKEERVKLMVREEKRLAYHANNDKELIKAKMRTALTFLKEFALTLKNIWVTSLVTDKRNHSPVFENNKTTSPQLVEQSFIKKEELSKDLRNSSNTSTQNNSPEIEERKKPLHKAVKSITLANTFSEAKEIATMISRGEAVSSIYTQGDKIAKTVSVFSGVSAACQTAAGSNLPINNKTREKKRRYTTPDECPSFNKTFAAIEKLSYEPVIKLE